MSLEVQPAKLTVRNKFGSTKYWTIFVMKLHKNHTIQEIFM